MFRKQWILECDECGTQVRGPSKQELKLAYDRKHNGGWGWKLVDGFAFCTVECEGRYLKS